MRTKGELNGSMIDCKYCTFLRPITKKMPSRRVTRWWPRRPFRPGGVYMVGNYYAFVDLYQIFTEVVNKYQSHSKLDLSHWELNPNMSSSCSPSQLCGFRRLIHHFSRKMRIQFNVYVSFSLQLVVSLNELGTVRNVLENEPWNQGKITSFSHCFGSNSLFCYNREYL